MKNIEDVLLVVEMLQKTMRRVPVILCVILHHYFREELSANFSYLEIAFLR